MKEWIERDEAVRQLGVKPQTLYAYVSRGRLRMTPDPNDSRRSLYSAEDIAQMTTRQSRGRNPETIAASSMAWGEPAIETSLSTVHQGRLYYRGQDAIELARTASLEEIARLLWAAEHEVRFPAAQGPHTQAFIALAALVPTAYPMLGREHGSLVSDATKIVGMIASVCGAAAGDDPLHVRLARGWGCNPSAAERLRQALVAMADHDLNASTFAARVAASTGASLPASVLAGLCALSGTRHGGAAIALRALIDYACATDCLSAIDRWLARGVEMPGFGHALYPCGDPRGLLMMTGLTLDPFLAQFRDAVLSRTGLTPNCDFGLATMVQALGLPNEAPFCLFLIGRSVGWCAHVMEQNQSGILIRPRGRYEGPMLANVVPT